MDVLFHLTILPWFAGFPFLVQEEISVTKDCKDIRIGACIIRVFAVNFYPKFNISSVLLWVFNFAALSFQSLFLIISFLFFPENTVAKVLNLINLMQRYFINFISELLWVDLGVNIDDYQRKLHLTASLYFSGKPD